MVQHPVPLIIFYSLLLYAGESQSAIVHCRPLLAIPAVVSVARLRKMPAKNGSAAAPEIAVEPIKRRFLPCGVSRKRVYTGK